MLLVALFLSMAAPAAAAITGPGGSEPTIEQESFPEDDQMTSYEEARPEPGPPPRTDPMEDNTAPPRPPRQDEPGDLGTTPKPPDSGPAPAPADNPSTPPAHPQPVDPPDPDNTEPSPEQIQQIQDNRDTYDGRQEDKHVDMTEHGARQNGYDVDGHTWAQQQIAPYIQPHNRGGPRRNGIRQPDTSQVQVPQPTDTPRKNPPHTPTPTPTSDPDPTPTPEPTPRYSSTPTSTPTPTSMSDSGTASQPQSRVKTSSSDTDSVDRSPRAAPRAPAQPPPTPQPIMVQESYQVAVTTHYTVTVCTTLYRLVPREVSYNAWVWVTVIDTVTEFRWDPEAGALIEVEIAGQETYERQYQTVTTTVYDKVPYQHCGAETRTRTSYVTHTRMVAR